MISAPVNKPPRIPRRRVLRTLTHYTLSRYNIIILTLMFLASSKYTNRLWYKTFLIVFSTFTCAYERCAHSGCRSFLIHPSFGFSLTPRSKIPVAYDFWTVSPWHGGRGHSLRSITVRSSTFCPATRVCRWARLSFCVVSYWMDRPPSLRIGCCTGPPPVRDTAGRRVCTRPRSWPPDRT